MPKPLSMTKALTPIPPEASISAFRELERQVGGRDQLISDLQHAELTEEEERLVNLLASPESDPKNLAMVAAQCGFSVGKLLKFLSKARGARAHIAALDHVYRAVPTVARDLMEEATTLRSECLKCAGVGKILPEGEEAVPITCAACWGKGEIQQHPDPKIRELALKVAGLIKDDKGGVNVNVSQQVGVGVLRTSTEFREATDRLLWQTTRKAASDASVDAEEVKVSEEQKPEPEPPGSENVQ